MEKKQEKSVGRKLFDRMLRLFFVCLMVLLTYVISVEGYAYGKALFSDRAVSTAKVEASFVVSEGQSVLSVAKNLEQRGLIADDFIFFSKAKLFHYTICPGVYTISPSMTDREILEKLSAASEESSRVQEKKK